MECISISNRKIQEKSFERVKLQFINVGLEFWLRKTIFYIKIVL